MRIPPKPLNDVVVLLLNPVPHLMYCTSPCIAREGSSLLAYPRHHISSHLMISSPPSSIPIPRYQPHKHRTELRSKHKHPPPPPGGPARESSISSHHPNPSRRNRILQEVPQRQHSHPPDPPRGGFISYLSHGHVGYSMPGAFCPVSLGRIEASSLSLSSSDPPRVFPVTPALHPHVALSYPSRSHYSA
jgi:hypothetical protein